MDVHSQPRSEHVLDVARVPAGSSVRWIFYSPVTGRWSPVPAAASVKRSPVDSAPRERPWLFTAAAPKRSTGWSNRSVRRGVRRYGRAGQPGRRGGVHSVRLRRPGGGAGRHSDQQRRRLRQPQLGGHQPTGVGGNLRPQRRGRRSLRAGVLATDARQCVGSDHPDRHGRGDQSVSHDARLRRHEGGAVEPHRFIVEVPDASGITVNTVSPGVVATRLEQVHRLEAAAARLGRGLGGHRGPGPRRPRSSTTQSAGSAGRRRSPILSPSSPARSPATSTAPTFASTVAAPLSYDRWLSEHALDSGGGSCSSSDG